MRYLMLCCACLLAASLGPAMAEDCVCGDGLSPILGCCGGHEQRPCVVESVFSDCESVCHSGNVLAPVGRCVDPADPGEACGPHRPCIEDHSCFLFPDGDGGLDGECYPTSGETDSVQGCLNLYSREFHEAILGAPTASVFGLGTTAGAVVAKSVETGVVYGGDGRFGCYKTECDGLLSDIDLNAYASQGLFGSYDAVSGQSTLLAESAGEGLNFVAWQVFDGTDLCPDPEDIFGASLIGTGSALSAGVGLPVQVGCYDCTTSVVTAVTTEVPPQAVCDVPEFCVSGLGPPEVPGGDPVPQCFEPDFSSLVPSGVRDALALAGLELSDLGGVVCAASDSCEASYDLDGGSYDPAGENVQVQQTPGGPYPVLPFPPTLSRIQQEFFSGSLPDVLGLLDYFNRLNVELTVTNDSGESGSCSSLVAVADCSPPQLRGCPDPVTLECAGPQGAYYEPSGVVTARDSCSRGEQVSGQPQAGWYPLGSTPLAITASNEWRGFFQAELGIPGEIFTSSCVDVCKYGNCSEQAARLSELNADGNDSVVMVVDTTAPDARGSCPAAKTVECQSNGSANVSYSTTAALDLCEDRSITPACDRASGSSFDLGTTSVECTATDRQGNADSCRFDVTVRDTTKPVLTLQGTVAPIECGAGSFTDPGAAVADSCDSSIASPVSGTGTVDTTSVGPYVVTYNASDATGNRADAVTRTVVVQDTMAPAVTCPADVTAECTANGGAPVTFTDASVGADQCDSNPATYNGCDRASGSTFTLASTPHTVSCTATDASGNTGSCAFAVSVVDTTAPAGSITGPANALCTSADSVTVLDDFTDACDSAVARTYSPGPGPTYTAHGDHAVTLLATDGSGNTQQDSVGFTIDRIAPVVELLDPARELTVPTAVPFSQVFSAHDGDGASGGVVHEVVKIEGCTIYDGNTYGDGDGLLSDEMRPVTSQEMCRISELCGFTSLRRPEIRVEATDCGGNVGYDAGTVAGSFRVLCNEQGGGGLP